MPDHEVFDQQKEVNSFHAHKSRLSIENPKWTEAMVYKQALIDFNTMMYPNQVKSYFSEKKGDRVGYVNQAYRIIDGDLFDPYYGFFQAMIDYETTEIGRASLKNFRQAAISALPGQTIPVLDMSGLGIGRGVKYLDTYVKDENDLIKHKERIDLTGNQRDLTLDEAKAVLGRMTEEDVWSKNVDLPQAWPLEVIPPMFARGGLTEIVKQLPTALIRADADNNLVFPAVGFWFMAAEALAKNEIEIERQTGEEIFKSKERTAVSSEVLFQAPIVDSQIFKSLPIALKNQVVLPTTEVSLVRVAPAVQPETVVQPEEEAVVARVIWPVAEENLKEEEIIYQARAEAEEVGLAKVEQLEPTEQEAVSLIAEQPLRERLPALEVESRSTVETEGKEEVVESVVSENQDKSLILPMTKMMVESEQEKITVSQVNRDKTVLPIWEIKMQGISLDDIPEWNLSSVLIGEDLGWSMTVPGLKAEEELETNAERAFKLGKWSEFDYLKKAVEVVETILLVIVNTNWEQPPRLRRRVVKDFGGDWGSGSVKYRQIQR